MGLMKSNDSIKTREAQVARSEWRHSRSSWIRGCYGNELTLPGRRNGTCQKDPSIRTSNDNFRSVRKVIERSIEGQWKVNRR